MSADLIARTLDDLVADRTVVRGEFRPGGHGQEYCDAGVLQRIRRRTIARLREEIEPVDLRTYGAFLPQWSGISSALADDADDADNADGATSATSADGATLADAMDRLSALALPASSVMGILRARIPSTQTSDIDSLLAAGSLTWWSVGALGSADMRVAWAATPIAAQLSAIVRGSGSSPLPTIDTIDQLPDLEQAIVEIVRGGGSFTTDAVHAGVIARGVVVSLPTLSAACLELARTGWLTCDSWSYIHSMVTGRSPARIASATSPRRSTSPARRSRLPRRTRLTTAPGGPRWSLAAPVAVGEKGSAHTQTMVEFAGLLLERWAVVSRASVGVEEPVGGFAALYPVLTSMSEAGLCQRVYAIEGAGGAQFALPGVVDEIRLLSDADTQHTVVVVLAVDPSNPFGAIIPWPDLDPERSSIRPTRRAGALVALQGGRLRGWLDPRGANLITYRDDARVDAPTGDERVDLLRAFAKGRARLVERSRSLLTSIDGTSLIGVPTDPSPAGTWAQAARQAGLTEVPRGWRWPTDA